jgi:hypothetical protein
MTPKRTRPCRPQINGKLERLRPDPGRRLGIQKVLPQRVRPPRRPASMAPRTQPPPAPHRDRTVSAHVQIDQPPPDSTTRHNEERQLRNAMGQVLRYRQQLTAKGHDVQAVIITSGPPTDGSWDDLCHWAGIVLAWPEVAAARLSAATEGH